MILLFSTGGGRGVPAETTIAPGAWQPEKPIWAPGDVLRLEADGEPTYYVGVKTLVWRSGARPVFLTGRAAQAAR